MIKILTRKNFMKNLLKVKNILKIRLKIYMKNRKLILKQLRKPVIMNTYN
jgi:hypothetical protein